MGPGLPQKPFGPPPEPSNAGVPAFDWREVLGLFAGSRILIWLVAGLSLASVSKGPYFADQIHGLGWFMRWDAGYYLQVATHGYAVDPTVHTSNVVFFPLYPLLVFCVSLGGLIPRWFAGYVVSLACLWLACRWLWQMVVREWRDPRLATLATAFLLFGPVSFFFSTLYSEALFLPLAIGCLAAARDGRWRRAGLFGMLAALTRIVGLVLIVPLLWQWLEDKFRDDRRSSRVADLLVACLLPAAGTLLYFAYLGLRFGDPLLYFHAENLEWGRHFAWFYGILARPSFTKLPEFYQLWFGGSLLVVFALLLAGILFRIPLSYSLYGLAAVGLYLSSRSLEAFPRYCSVIFPFYAVLALLGRRWPRVTLPLLALSVALLALSTVLYVNGYWFT